jgi:hypothetical protein
MIFVANPEFAAPRKSGCASKCGGLSTDADEIMAGKLREKGMVITVAGLKDALLRTPVRQARENGNRSNEI